jgi:hypothetical protein
MGRQKNKKGVMARVSAAADGGCLPRKFPAITKELKNKKGVFFVSLFAPPRPYLQTRQVCVKSLRNRP